MEFVAELFAQTAEVTAPVDGRVSLSATSIAAMTVVVTTVCGLMSRWVYMRVMLRVKDVEMNVAQKLGQMNVILARVELSSKSPELTGQVQAVAISMGMVDRRLIDMATLIDANGAKMDGIAGEFRKEHSELHDRITSNTRAIATVEGALEERGKHDGAT